MANWHIFRGDGSQHDRISEIGDPPKWREFKGKIIKYESKEDEHTERRFGVKKQFLADDEEIDIINAALYLRRPLLVTGKPGTGKSSLAYAVAHELKLGKVLYWPITTRSTLQDALYKYDALARLQDLQIRNYEGKEALKEMPHIGEYIRLGPLGTAFLPSKKPRVLLIDEIDKSDIDLPNDLLTIFEEGQFVIQELKRLSPDKETEEVYVFSHDSETKVPIPGGGTVRCNAFPFIVLTSNAERELPPPFLRRCLRLDIRYPDEKKLEKIVEAHFGATENKDEKKARMNLIKKFLSRRSEGDLATDQLLNAIYLTSKNINLFDNQERLIQVILKHLNEMGTV
jgi:MoxR-like ATPase